MRIRHPRLIMLASFLYPIRLQVPYRITGMAGGTPVGAIAGILTVRIRHGKFDIEQPKRQTGYPTPTP